MVTVESLSPRDPRYRFVRKKFRVGWQHPDKGPPSIHKILLLHHTTYAHTHERYRDMVRARRGNANVQYRFHGTDRTCHLGDNNNELNLCNWRDCSLCSILRSSFNTSRAGSNHSFRRFGNGIYSSSASSKADSYSDNNVSSTYHGYHSMIFAEVVVGSTKELYANAQHLTAPPRGYDSVTGLPSPHGPLNYPETVVYQREAICPKAVVIYKRFEAEEEDSDEEDDEGCVVA